MTAPDEKVPWPRSPVAIRIAGWIAAIALVALLANRAPSAALRVAIERADRTTLAVAGVLALAIEVFAASWKYRAILALLGFDVPLREVITVRMGTYPLRNLVPLKAGEIARVAYLRRVHGVPVARTALAAVIDPATDAIGLLSLAMIGWSLDTHRASWVIASFGVALITVGLAVRWATQRFAPNESLPAARKSAWLTLVGSTFAVVVVDLVVFGLTLRAFHVPVPISAMARFVPIVVLVSGLPVTPMGIGVREAAASWLLASYGSAESLLASALVASALLKLVPTACGIPFIRPLLRSTIESKR